MSAFGRIYETFTDPATEGDETSIPPEAVEHVPRSFSLNALNGACTKLAEQLASPGAVLALLIGVVSAPVAFIGMLEPIRRGASLAPQLAIAGRIRARRLRKGFWVAAGLTQAAALALMLLGAATLEGVGAGVAIVACLALFSLASGVGSVAFGDVVGKTVPERNRGQLLALRGTAGGALTLIAGLVLLGLDRSDELAVFLALLGAAALLWFVAALLFAGIPEPEGEPAHQRSPLEEARAGIAQLTDSPGLRAFTLARALLLSVELALPFLVFFTRTELGGADVIAAAVISIGLANLLSNFAWGRVADRISTRLTMLAAGALGSLAIGGVLLLGAVATEGTPVLAFAPVFFLATAAEAGIRVGRKAWVVNAAPETERPLWIAASNTLAGMVTLTFILLGGLAQATSVTVTLITLLTLSLAGLGATYRMPEDSRA